MNALLGSYTLGESIGRLPLGQLFAATYAGQSDRRAILVIAPELATLPQYETALRREASALRTAIGPYLAQLIEVGRRDDTLFVVYELAEGRTLAARLAADEPFAPDRACRLIQGLAEALDSLHKRRLVHGLLAPESVVVADDGTPSLLGAGLLVAVDETDLGDAIGSRVNLPFIAPEQTRGQHAVASADAYALGALAHLLLIGVAPSDAIDDPDPFDDLSAGIAQASTDPFTLIGAVLRRQINRRPDLRYETCQHLAETLAGALAVADGTAAQEIPVLRPDAPANRPNAAWPTTSQDPARPPRDPSQSAQPSSRLLPMSPMLRQAVEIMHNDLGSSLLQGGLPVIAVIVAGAFGLVLLAGGGFLGVVGVAILGIFLLVVIVLALDRRRLLLKDVRAGQVLEVVGPAELKRVSGKNTTNYYLELHDSQRLSIHQGLYDRLVKLAAPEPEPGFLTRLLASDPTTRVGLLTVILLPESEMIVEIRDTEDRVVHREPRLTWTDRQP